MLNDILCIELFVGVGSKRHKEVGSPHSQSTAQKGQNVPLYNNKHATSHQSRAEQHHLHLHPHLTTLAAIITPA